MEDQEATNLPEDTAKCREEGRNKKDSKIR